MRRDDKSGEIKAALKSFNCLRLGERKREKIAGKKTIAMLWWVGDGETAIALGYTSEYTPEDTF